MSRYVIIENGKVVNAAVANQPFADNWIESEDADVGDLYADGVFTKYDPKSDPVAIVKKEKSVRDFRDETLKLSVDTLNPIRWAALSTEQQEAWTTYRQALLDLTDQPGFPFEIVWPTKPE